MAVIDCRSIRASFSSGNWLRLVSSLFLAPLAVQGESDSDWRRVVVERPEMGVAFRVVVYARDAEAASEAATDGLDRVRTLNAIFSDYEFDSEVSRLSRTAGSGEWVEVSPEFWRTLKRARGLGQRSDGAFDVTLGSATALWRESRRQGVFPEARKLALARSRIGWKHLQMRASDRTVFLERPSMLLDFGGIAKGVALDAVLDAVTQAGFPRALVQAGGDMALGAPPPGREGWRVRVLPDDQIPNAPSRDMVLSDLAVATSGDLYQFVEIDGVRYSHILDPRTGVGLTARRRAVVLAEDATTADPLATTLCVLGMERSLAFAEAEGALGAHYAETGSNGVIQRMSASFAQRLNDPPPIGDGTSD